MSRLESARGIQEFRSEIVAAHDRHLRPMRWALGGFLAFIAALMLVAPHRLPLHRLTELKPYLPLLGVVALAAGFGLLNLGALCPSRRTVIWAHAVGGALLLMLAGSFALRGTWLGVSNYGVLGLGLLAAPLLPQTCRRLTRRGGDVLTLLIGVILSVDGVLAACFPGTIGQPLHPFFLAHRLAFAGAYLVAGGSLLATLLHHRLARRRGAQWAARVLAGVVLGADLTMVAVPSGVWMATAFYAMLVISVLAMRPLTIWALRVRTTSFQMRLAFLLATATAVPVIVTLALVSAREERLVWEDAFDQEKSEAAVLAQFTDECVSLHQAAIRSMAADPGFAELSPAAQHREMERLQLAYPAVAGLAYYQVDGTPVARSDTRPLGGSIAGQPILEHARRTGRPWVEVSYSRVLGQVVANLSEPVRNQQGKLAGLLVLALDPSHLARFLIPPDRVHGHIDSTAYLVDERGRVIADPQATQAMALTDLSGYPPVSKAIADRQDIVTGLFQAPGGEHLYAYAHVATTGWHVILDHPMANILATACEARELAFGALVLCLLIIVGGGVLVAHFLTVPLAALGHAASEFSTGNAEAPVPTSTVTEIQQLAATFRQMRCRLGRRTRQRQEAEEALRRANESLEATVAQRTKELQQANIDLMIRLAQLQEAEEAADRARVAAEEANTAKDQFLAVLSHELRTPLTPVLLSTVAMEHAPDLPQSVRDEMVMIRRNVELEARLIDDLLDLTRVTRGKLTLQLRQTDAHAKIQEVVGICRPELDAKNQRLVLDLTADDHRLIADPARLQQIIWNLLKNAVKFTPAGGLITIRTSNPHPVPAGTHGAAGAPLVLEIIDTGIGIPGKLLPQVFDAFEQGGSRITRRFGGLGLGLAISRRLAEIHGGTLVAASAGHNLGSTFTLTLPTTTSPGPAPTAAPAGDACLNSRSPGSSRPAILLVEDNADTARIMGRLLEGLGYQVRTASTVASALATAHAHPFDLLISDIGLPDGSGLDLLRQLQKHGPVRAIAVSGYGMDSDVRKSQHAGFMAHVTKPLDFAALHALIERALAPAPHQGAHRAVDPQGV